MNNINSSNPFIECKGIKEKKLVLRQLSIQAKAIIKKIKEEMVETEADIALPRVNDVLLDSYKNDEHKEFKTFMDWKKNNYKVIKGAKAFVIWGRLRNTNNNKKDKTNTNKNTKVLDDYKFYPLAFLFSNYQVEPINNYS